MTATEVVVDTSAAVALLTGESVGAWVMDVLDGARRRVLSAASLVELGIVLEARFGPVGSAVADRFLRDAAIEVVPLDREQADLAVTAWRRFGKSRHAAGLNLGDCFTYALAAALGLPVLCIGGDLPATDLEIVDRPA